MYLPMIDAIIKIQKQLSAFNLNRSCNEVMIKILKDKVETPKSQVKYLAALYTDVSDKFDEITKTNQKAKESVEQTVVQKSLCG